MIDMAPSRKNITQVTTTTPTALKEKGKIIEVPEPANRCPNLFDVHIFNVDDSHSNSASPREMEAAEPEPQPNGEQVLQMTSIMRMQMKDQQIEMIRLREAAAREKEAATRVQTRLLKQIGTRWKSQSSLTAEENARTLPSPLRTQKSTHSTRSLRRNRLEMYEDDEDSGKLQAFSNPEVLSHRGYHRFGSGAAQSSGLIVSKGDGVQRAEILRLTAVKKNHHALLPEEACNADFRSLLRNF